MEAFLIQILPLTLIQLIFAAVFFNLAKRLGSDPWLWALLCAIPVVGAFMIGFLQLRALFILARRLPPPT